MATTYVYASTSVDVPVNLRLDQLGPSDIGARLDQNQLPARSSSTQRIAEIPRMVDSHLYTLNVPLSLARATGPAYLVSLQVLIRGHGLGSMIWWRWRTRAAAVGSWVTDHDPHSVVCFDGQQRYEFVVQGVGTFGYDDISISLRLV